MVYRNLKFEVFERRTKKLGERLFTRPIRVYMLAIGSPRSGELFTCLYVSASFG